MPGWSGAVCSALKRAKLLNEVTGPQHASGHLRAARVGWIDDDHSDKQAIAGFA